MINQSDKEIKQTCYQVKNRNRRYNIQHISITMKTTISDMVNKIIAYCYAGVVLPAGPVPRGHPNGRRASQSHILAGPVGQP